jgi:DNA-binding response OmpR family regulator
MCVRMVSQDMEKTVLVADDDGDVLNLVRFRLERDGLRVLTAADGIEALELARAARPHVCVLDVMMPKLGGLELLRRLREDPATSGTRIILLTARSADDHIDEGFEFGADDYVTKPFNPQELRQRVRAQLQR